MGLLLQLLGRGERNERQVPPRWAFDVGVAPLVLVPTAEQVGPPVESSGSVVRRHLAGAGYH